MSTATLEFHDLHRAPAILRQAVELLAESDDPPAGFTVLCDIADQIEQQAKPPRMDEPGKYAIVRAKGSGLAECEWVNEGRYWTSLSGDPHAHTTRWVNLDDPILVRDGIAS